MAAQHGKAGIAWQTVLGADFVQRSGDEGRADEVPACVDLQRRMGERESLGDDHRAEVELLTHKEVGPPPVAQRKDIGGSLAGDAAAEADTDVAHVLLQIGLDQRQPLRREADIRSGRECGEPEGLDLRDHPGTAHEGHTVTRRLSRASDGDERLQVTAATREGEEKSPVAGQG